MYGARLPRTRATRWGAMYGARFPRTRATP